MKKKIVFALTSNDQLGTTGRKTGVYAPELAHPARVFLDAGYEVDYVSVKGGQPPMDGIKPDDEVTNAFLQDEEIASRLAATKRADEVDPSEYGAIYFSGGHGTMWDFPQASGIAQLASDIYAAGGVVATVCHGSSGLTLVTDGEGKPIVAGKTISCFTNEEEAAAGLDTVVPFLLEERIAELGGTVTKGGVFKEHTVVDGNLVTGQNPASAIKVAELTLAKLD